MEYTKKDVEKALSMCMTECDLDCPFAWADGECIDALHEAALEILAREVARR